MVHGDLHANGSNDALAPPIPNDEHIIVLLSHGRKRTAIG